MLHIREAFLVNGFGDGRDAPEHAVVVNLHLDIHASRAMSEALFEHLKTVLPEVVPGFTFSEEWKVSPYRRTEITEKPTFEPPGP